MQNYGYKFMFARLVKCDLQCAQFHGGQNPWINLCEELLSQAQIGWGKIHPPPSQYFFYVRNIF